MLRQVSALALVALAGSCFVGSLKAQSQPQSSSASPPPSLSERLELFRQDLLGEPRPTAKKRQVPVTQTPPRSANSPAAVPPKPLYGTPGQNDSNPAPSPPAPLVARAPAQLSEVPIPPIPAREPTPVAASDGGALDVLPKSSQTLIPQPARKAHSGSAFNPLPVDAAVPQGPPAKASEPREAGKPTLADPDLEAEIEPVPLRGATAPARETGRAREGASFPDPVPREAMLPREALPMRAEPAPLRSAKLERSFDPTPAAPVSDSAAAGSKRPPGDSVLLSGQSPVLMVETLGPRKVSIGKEAVFSVKIRNGGDGAANNVVVSLNIPSYAEVLATQPSAGVMRGATGSTRSEATEWHIARLEPRARETLTVRLIPRKSSPIDLAVQWNCSAESSQTVVEVQEPKLAMTMSGPSEILYGQSKIYKLTLANPGSGDAENVSVSLLPMGRSTEAPTSHRVGTIKAGLSKTIEVELTARQAGTLSIKAEATADGGLRAETAEQVVVRRAGLKIDMQGPKAKFAGTPATYHLQVSNSGNSTAEKVQISAALPPQAKFLSATNGGHFDSGQSKVVWSVGSLQAGAERSFDVNCVLQAPGENRLQVTATAADDLASQTVAATRVEAVADLKLEVRDPQGPVALTDEAVYEVVIKNRGTKNAEGIDLVVFFSEGLEATACVGHAHQIDRGQVTFKTIPTLAAGSEIVLRVNARAEVAGNHIFRAEVACHSPPAKLAAEETTLFYGEETAEKPGKLREGSPADQLQPVDNR